MKEGASAEARSTARNTGGAPGANFEYEDNEWDVGIGDLIIDLDADIEKNNDSSGVSPGSEPGMGLKPNSHNNNNSSVAADKGLKMKIKRRSEAKHEIVHPECVAKGAAGQADTMGAGAGATDGKDGKDGGKDGKDGGKDGKAASRSVARRVNASKKERKDKDAVKSESENGELSSPELIDADTQPLAKRQRTEPATTVSTAPRSLPLCLTLWPPAASRDYSLLTPLCCLFIGVKDAPTTGSVCAHC